MKDNQNGNNIIDGRRRTKSRMVLLEGSIVILPLLQAELEFQLLSWLLFLYPQLVWHCWTPHQLNGAEPMSNLLVHC